MGIEQKSIAALIDELATNQIRLWMCQEDVMAGGDDAFVAEASRKAQTLNARRNQLMRAIDTYFDDPNILAAKSYDPEAKTEQSMEQKRIEELEQALYLLIEGLKTEKQPLIIERMRQAQKALDRQWR